MENLTVTVKVELNAQQLPGSCSALINAQRNLVLTAAHTQFFRLFSLPSHQCPVRKGRQSCQRLQ